MAPFSLSSGDSWICCQLTLLSYNSLGGTWTGSRGMSVRSKQVRRMCGALCCKRQCCVGLSDVSVVGKEENSLEPSKQQWSELVDAHTALAEKKERRTSKLLLCCGGEASVELVAEILVSWAVFLLSARLPEIGTGREGLLDV